MPIFILPGNRHNLQVFGPQDMPPKKRQPPIDTFFRRTRQKSDSGSSEVIETVIIGDESKISQHQLPCSFCGQNFGNAGALECHRLRKHPGSREVGQSCISVETIGTETKKRGFLFPAPFWACALMHATAGICWQAVFTSACTKFVPLVPSSS